jgi:hypothetical protein
MYSSALTVDSQTYLRNDHGEEVNYYYEAIQVNVVENGYYTLASMSAVNTIGYIYMNNFNSSNPIENFLSQDDYSCGGNQFKLITYLQANTTYILVVTTYVPKETGQFSILAFGPNNVRLNHSEYMYYFMKDQQRSSKYRKSSHLNFYFDPKKASKSRY